MAVVWQTLMLRGIITGNKNKTVVPSAMKENINSILAAQAMNLNFQTLAA